MFGDDRRMSEALDRYLTDAPEPLEDVYLEDFDGRVLEVGTRVRYYDYDPHHPGWARENDQHYFGTVLEVSDWDADADDDGRSITIAPSVTVRFDDGSTDSYPTSEWEHDGWMQPSSGKVEELAVVGPPDVGRVRLRSRTIRRRSGAA